MAEYQGYSDLAKQIAGGLIVENINEMVNFVAEGSSLQMLRLLGGTLPSGHPGTGFKERPGLIQKKSIDSYQHKWISQSVAPSDLIMNGAKTTETALVLTSGTYPRVAEGCLYQAEHPDTGAFLELIMVYQDTGSAYTANVRRNIGGTSNAALPDGTILRRRSMSVSDRSSQVKMLDVDPTTTTNLTQTIRHDWEATWKGTAVKEYGDLNQESVIRRRKLYDFTKEMNWSFLYGKGGTSTDKSGKRVQFMTGLTNLLSSNLYSAQTAQCAGYTAGHGGEITLDKYRNVFLRRLCRFLPEDVTDVIVLHGDLIDRALDSWYEEKIGNLGQNDGYLGWECRSVRVAGKTFRHMYDSSVDANDTGSAIVFPPRSLTHLYTSGNGINLDMKHYLIDFEKQGITSKGGFYLWDGSLAISWEQGMGMMTGVESFA